MRVTSKATALCCWLLCAKARWPELVALGAVHTQRLRPPSGLLTQARRPWPKRCTKDELAEGEDEEEECSRGCLQRVLQPQG